MEPGIPFWISMIMGKFVLVSISYFFSEINNKKSLHENLRKYIVKNKEKIGITDCLFISSGMKDFTLSVIGVCCKHHKSFIHNI